MSSHPDDLINSPPELPQYLNNVYELKPIVGAPNDRQLIGIHTVMQMAQKTVDVPGMGGSAPISQLVEHLFNAQMARYRSRCFDATFFPENTTYNPPTLPAHLSVQLEPISGVPSDEEIVKVQDAIRSYQQLSNVSSSFDPSVNMELSQHLFDIQMAKYMQRVKQRRSTPIPRDRSNSTSTAIMPERIPNQDEEPEVENNLRTQPEPELLPPNQSTQRVHDIENQERSNLLIERSNEIADRANQLVEQSNRPLDQSNHLVKQLTESFGILNEHLGRLNHPSESYTKPVGKLGEVLANMNRVLVGIQHTIVRNYRGNTVKAADCLVNEKGETPSQSQETSHASFEWLSQQYGEKADCQLPVVIGGSQHNLHINNRWLGIFLRFYGVGEELFKDESGPKLKEGNEDSARVLLGNYLSTCLG